eukprot:m.18316 g.18316  ORF g.18316 m.18316 type:complete len:328 (-) comp6281_c0_seq1:207-1190(-)
MMSNFSSHDDVCGVVYAREKIQEEHKEMKKLYEKCRNIFLFRFPRGEELLLQYDDECKKFRGLIENFQTLVTSAIQNDFFYGGLSDQRLIITLKTTLNSFETLLLREMTAECLSPDFVEAAQPNGCPESIKAITLSKSGMHYFSSFVNVGDKPDDSSLEKSSRQQEDYYHGWEVDPDVPNNVSSDEKLNEISSQHDKPNGEVKTPPLVDEGPDNQLSPEFASKIQSYNDIQKQHGENFLKHLDTANIPETIEELLSLLENFLKEFLADLAACLKNPNLEHFWEDLHRCINRITELDAACLDAVWKLSKFVWSYAEEIGGMQLCDLTT